MAGEQPGVAERGARRRIALTGLWVGLVMTSVVFLVFAIVYLFRRTFDGWVPVPLPHILWWNTAALVASSVVLDGARHALKRGRRTAFNYYWLAATLLGCAFLAGQGYAWKQLSDAG